MISVRINKGQFNRLQADLGFTYNQLQRLQVRAVNRTATGLRTYVDKKIRKETPLKQKEVQRKNMRLRKARRGHPSALLKITGRQIPIKEYAARQKKEGVSYRILRRKRRTTIKSAFKNAVFKEVSIFKREGKRRGPVRIMLGPSLPQLMQIVPGLTEEKLKAEAERRLQKEMAGQVALALAKLKAS